MTWPSEVGYWVGVCTSLLEANEGMTTSSLDLRSRKEVRSGRLSNRRGEV